jgi:hypothetical protein
VVETGGDPVVGCPAVMSPNTAIRVQSKEFSIPHPMNELVKNGNDERLRIAPIDPSDVYLIR